MSLVSDGADWKHPVDAAARNHLIAAVTAVQASGLKSLPVRDFKPPSRKLTGVPGQDWW